MQGYSPSMGASFRADPCSRATGNVDERIFIDVEVIGILISPWLTTRDMPLGLANVQNLARELSPSNLLAKSKASK